MFVLYTRFKSNTDLWYLDSKCSRYMTNDAIVFLELEESNQLKVTVGVKKS